MKLTISILRGCKRTAVLQNTKLICPCTSGRFILFFFLKYSWFTILLAFGVQQSDSITCMYSFFRFFSFIGYYKMLSIVPIILISIILIIPHLLRKMSLVLENGGSHLAIRRLGASCSVAQSCLTLGPHGLQHARLPGLSPSPGACSNSCPLSW